ncbi:MAG: prepilin peptidase [Acidimicrobiales bacterium]
MNETVLVVGSVLFGGACGWTLRPVTASFDAAVPKRVPVTEILTGLLFGLAAAEYDDWRLVALFVFLAASVALSVVDLIQYRLPNLILFPAIAVSAAIIVIGQIAEGDAERLSYVLVGALLYSGILLLMHLISPAGMGFGDVKLGLLLGMFAGWVATSRFDAVRSVMIALLIGSALGVVLGGGRILVARLGGRFLPDPEEGSAGEGWRRTTFPFGPPLMAGAILVALYPGVVLGG